MYSYLANPRATREVLDQFGFTTKHHLGQNFLVSDAVIGHILELADLKETDTVLEVGPGIGTLTCALLPRAQAVVSLEADRSLEPVLQETCAQRLDHLRILWGDALRLDPQDIQKAFAELGCREAPDAFVSNLPYQVAATVLLRFFQVLDPLKRAVVMVQCEVADRIVAQPGSKEYGAYTVKLRLFAQVTGRFNVSPSNFMPQPHVESCVVRLERCPQKALTNEELQKVFQVVNAAFCQRRKTIRNAMSSAGFDKNMLDVAFAKAGIEPSARAERLEVDQFIDLERALDKAGFRITP